MAMPLVPFCTAVFWENVGELLDTSIALRVFWVNALFVIAGLLAVYIHSPWVFWVMVLLAMVGELCSIRMPMPVVCPEMLRLFSLMVLFSITPPAAWFRRMP